MGFYGNLEIKNKARLMRKEGDSYNKIMDKLGLSKSTVSDWCKDIKLTKRQEEKLYKNKITGALKGSYIASQNKIKKRIILTEKLFQKGFNEVKKISKRDRFIAGIAFYAAEGTKIDKGCCVSNSDPFIIKFMVNWFKEFGKVTANKFRGAIWLHDNLNEFEAIKYWSSLTNIPKSHFYKTYIAKNKENSKKIRKNKHEYGVFSFYVNDTNLLRIIMGWISGVIQKPMV